MDDDMAVVFRSSQRAMNGAVLDRAAVCVSAVCLIQCLMLAVVVILTPVASIGFLGNDSFHLFLLAVIVPLSVTAFALGYRVHRNARLLVPGLLGLGVVLAAAVLEATLLSPLASALLTSSGGLLLIVGHWLNLRQRRRVCLQPEV